MSISELPFGFLATSGTLFALLWGSFLNVVIYRVPRGMSVAFPASHCPQCDAPIRPYDNVPLVSFLCLRGRARCCKAPLSPRYFWVELLCGALGLALIERLVHGLPPDTELLRAGMIYLADLALCLGLVAVTFIDLEYMYVPDAISIGGTVLGLLTYSIRTDLRLMEVIVGAAGGFALVWLPFSVLYRALRGRTGMGLGDAKLVMLAGAWFGMGGAVFALLAGAVQGTVCALLLLVFRGTIEEPAGVRAEREQTERELLAMSEEERRVAQKELAKDPLYEELPPGKAQLRMAFGPFLALATIEYLFLGDFLVSHYLSWTSFEP